MRVLLLISIFIFSLVQARAETQAEKLCIIASAQKIPVIQNLQIENSRIDGGKSPYTVEIDTLIANKKVTFVFVCATSEGKPAFSSLAGIK